MRLGRSAQKTRRRHSAGRRWAGAEALEPRQLLAGAAPDPSLRIGDYSVAPGAEVLVTLEMFDDPMVEGDEAGAPGAIAFDLYLHYDTTLLDLTSDAVTGTGLMADWSFFANVNDETGEVLIAAFYPFGLASGTGNLVSFQFTVPADANGIATLDLATDGSLGPRYGFDDGAFAPLSLTDGSVNVLGNDAPVAANDSYSTLQDTVLTVAAPGVLTNDTDANNDPLAAVLVSGPAHGSLTLTADGSFTYTPVAGYFGSDSFTYSADDGSLQSLPATVSIEVTSALWVGTDGPDDFILRLDESRTLVQLITRTIEGETLVRTVPSTSQLPLHILTGDGADRLTLDGVNGNPLPAAGVRFDGGAAEDAVAILGGPGVEEIAISDTRVTLGGLQVDMAAVERVDVDGGGGLDQISASGRANVGFNRSQVIGALSISDEAHVRLAQSGSLLMDTRALAISGNAKLDVADNDLVVRNTSGEAGYAQLVAISALIKSARNTTPLWQGPGITTSTANSLTGLAVRLVGTDVRIKFTWNGDVDLNGKVDAADYFAVDSGFLAQSTGYANGDLDFSGKVDAADYFLIDSAFLGQSGVLAASPTKTVVVSTKPHKGARKAPRGTIL